MCYKRLHSYSTNPVRNIHALVVNQFQLRMQCQKERRQRPPRRRQQTILLLAALASRAAVNTREGGNKAKEARIGQFTVCNEILTQ